MGLTQQEGGEKSEYRVLRRQGNRGLETAEVKMPSQWTPTSVNSGLVDPTQSVVRRQLDHTAESELVNSEQPKNTDESESTHLRKSIEA